MFTLLFTSEWFQCLLVGGLKNVLCTCILVIMAELLLQVCFESHTIYATILKVSAYYITCNKKKIGFAFRFCEMSFLLDKGRGGIF